MTPVPPRLHLAMLTYGALAATRRCLASLQAHTDVPFLLSVIDNGSTDGTREWLAAQRLPWLRHRCNAHNRGVPGGRNDLFEFVLPTLQPHDWIVFVDNDLEFGDGWAQPFLQAMHAWPRAGVLGKVGHFLQVGEQRRTLMPAPVVTGPVDVVSGGFACCIRADVARAVGRFDEQLGLFWHEDDDWCVRALQAGVQVVAVPESRITHHEHASGVADAGLAEGGSLRNQRYLVQKWRAAGLVDRDGWIVQRQGPWVAPEVRDELRRRAGRRSPIGRTELAAALVLLEQGIDQRDPVAWHARHRQPVPACMPALLALHRELAQQAGHADLVAQLDRLERAFSTVGYTALLRPLVRPQVQPDTGVVGHGVCAGSDFDQPEFAAIAREMGIADLVADPQARDRTQWENVAAARQLDLAGVAAAGRCVAVVGARPALLQRWLRSRGVEVVDWRARDLAPADAIVCHRQFDPEVVAELVAASAAGLLVFVGDVALNGVPSVDAPMPQQLVHDLLGRAGLVAVAPIRRVVEDAVLEACIDRAGRELATPQLCWLHGAQLRSSFVVVARPSAPPRPTVLVPARPRTAPGLRVGVDLRTLLVADSVCRGIGKFTEQHLQAIVQAAPDVRLLGYVTDVRQALPRSLPPTIEVRSLDRFAPEDVDLVHVPDPMNATFGFDSPLRVLRHPRTTITMHDLTPLHHYLAHWPRRHQEAYRDRLRQIETSGCQLLANSAFTAADVCRHLQVAADRVTPILAGLHHGSRPRPEAATIARVRTELGVAGPFVLHVGALDPHKNFFTALSAFLQVRARQPLQLVVVGAVDPGHTNAAALCANKGIRDVVFTGYLPRGHLDVLYAEAAALLFLSRAEGFGFPILEAMAAGCPVVASDATSHPEVAGDAAVLVGVDDAAAAAAAVTRLLAEPAFAQQLRRRGLAQAGRFPWSAVAERTLAVWRAMVGAAAAAPVRAVPVLP